MKVLLSIILCLLVVDYSFCIQKKALKLPQPEAQDLVNAINICIPKSGIMLVDLLQVVDGGYIDSKSFKDFLICCYKNAKYLGPDGLIDIEKTAKLFPNETAFGEEVRRCGYQQVGRDAKEAVFSFFKCFQDTVPYKLTVQI